MSTSPDDAIRLAKQLAEEARVETAAHTAADTSAAAHATASAESPVLQIPMFLHEREVTDALRTVALLASGRNPFQPEALDRLSAAQQIEVLRALAIIVSTFGQTHPQQRPALETVEPYDDGTEPAAKRPLEEYLDRIEKQAILEALEEARHNRTEAARLLGITFRALRYRMERLRIE